MIIKMFVYSKLYDLLTGRHTTSGRPALRCTIKELYGKHNKLKYIYFQTENGIPCLLHISDRHEVKMDVKKCLNIVDWKDDSSELNSVLAADSETTIVKKIRATQSPLGYVHFLNKLKPSLASIPYTVAVITEEFLVIINNDDEKEEINIHHISGSQEKKLLIVLDLETLLFKNVIPEIERVHKNIMKLITDDNSEYWKSLFELLQKCKQIKIISKGKEDSLKHNFLDESVKLQTAQHAVKIALNYFD